MIVENQAGIPLIMQSLSGNKSDKKSFSEAITTHIEQLQTELDVEYLIGDSALYTAESLKKMDHLFWITRVPEVLKDALIKKEDQLKMQNQIILSGKLKEVLLQLLKKESLD